MTRLTIEEIDEQMNIAAERVDEGRTCASGQSFEEGVLAALGWITEDTYDVPLNPDDDLCMAGREARP